MKITIDLSADESIALRRMASELGCSNEDAAKTALRDWQIANDYLELDPCYSPAKEFNLYRLTPPAMTT